MGQVSITARRYRETNIKQKLLQPYIGTAGWTIPRTAITKFPDKGSHLERYAQRFNATEINSTFHRVHRPATYKRWADSVPNDFKFAVKMPRSITHDARLQKSNALLDEFLSGATELGHKLGPVLVQFPPSLKFERKIANAFFKAFRKNYKGIITCEPRHRSWFEEAAEDMLLEHDVTRVAADPAPVASAAEPGGSRSSVYFRLHGSPEVYRSSYSKEYISRVADKMSLTPKTTKESWCIFDNTTFGFAISNAMELKQHFIK